MTGSTISDPQPSTLTTPHRRADAAAARHVRGSVRHRRAIAIAIWLNLVAAMIVVTLAVGGATRITDSGLSITRWEPVVGIVPPLSEAAWQAELEEYRQIPEYQLVNKGMSLEAFKRIYWWEWGHRISGRLIGLVFAVPFAAFLLLGGMPGWLKWRLALLFGLGGLQGVVGWWMVASGLVDRVDVSHYRLAVHLGLACLLLVLTVWTAQRVAADARADTRCTRDGPRRTAPGAGTATARAVSPAGGRGAMLLLVLLFVQILLGALVAGLDAGLAWNTWPLMDGALIPEGLFFESPWWINLLENRLTVQFDHRVFGYLLVVAAGWHAVAVARSGWGAAAYRAAALFALIVLQAVIGIHVVVWNMPAGLALAHQLTAAALLWLATVHALQMRAAGGSVALAPRAPGG